MLDSPTMLMPPPVAVEILVTGGSINKFACLAISSWITVCVAPVSGQHVTIILASSFPTGVSHSNNGGVGLLWITRVCASELAAVASFYLFTNRSWAEST